MRRTHRTHRMDLPVPAAPACRRGRERGVALLTALLLMLAVLTTSIAAARAAIGGARAAGHERDRMLALQGAMAALADAEHDIEGGRDPGSARGLALAHADAVGAADAFAAGCAADAPYAGLCAHAPGGGHAVFAALADEEGPGVELGAFTGAQIPVGGGPLAAQAPRYLIERMPSGPEALLYRITALGFGSAAATQVAVQAYYRKALAAGPAERPGEPGAGPGTEGPEGAGPDDPAEGPGAMPADGPTDPAAAPAAAPAADPPAPDQPIPAGMPGGPGLRVGWREIGNWREVAAAAADGG